MMGRGGPRVGSRALLLLALLLPLLLFQAAHGFSVSSCRPGRSLLVARSSRGNPQDDATDMRGISGMKGYYRRPSRAIEKGGGFYVPGLEGERIRIITAAALVLMYVANRAGQTVASFPQVVSELTGLSLAMLLFAQGVVDVVATSAPPADGSSPSASSAAPAFLSVLQQEQGQGQGQGAAAAVAETLARSVAQTSADACYVALLRAAPSNASGAQVVVELGPVGGGGGTRPMTAQAAATILAAFPPAAAAAVPTPTEVLSRAEFAGRVGGAGAGAGEGAVALPAGAARLAVVRRGRGLLWLVGVGGELDVKWLEALLSAPLGGDSD